MFSSEDTRKDKVKTDTGIENRVHRGLGDGFCGCSFKKSKVVRGLYVSHRESVQESSF